MDAVEFRARMDAIGHGTRSFSILRSDVGERPLASSEQIADQLSDEISRELILPGAPLREQALSSRFGVSRGPVREALRLLEKDDLVRLSPNRGAVVTTYSRAEMQHIADISWPITRLHLGQLFAKADDDVLASLIAAQRRVGLLLIRPAPVEFALELAALSMAQARFGIGRPGELILQLLYRPSIRYTITGLAREGAAAGAETRWREYMMATAERDSEAAARHVLTMLRDLHLPVLDGVPE